MFDANEVYIDVEIEFDNGTRNSTNNLILEQVESKMNFNQNF